ncbi:hypothetical protein AVEN_179275-1 [Araneus ventricosus]|uniref:Uncharacterized protein n=1 Tax=Araneus ventricosus TaxID=182803 RepID=A0A4Y2NE89_ARAVE|nr:hypothetical protein AVEN_234180-1 [Araneus ventricosus]GBN28067.1 hypothetical protein AVEN_51395-1 [Araneus ventricosus]GBN37263.1 hypothetical protein AVEN_84882-1 [Araneus ventricosus]GBN37362.1 hypothetical protein AVEN_179275-1 [Araneus ventricosus]
MFRFEATRGLFWDGSRNFEPQSDDEEDTRAGTSPPNFDTIPGGGRLASTYDLTCNRPTYIHGGSSVESDFEPRTIGFRTSNLMARSHSAVALGYY